MFEAAQVVGVVAGGRADQFEGNIAAQSFVARAKDFAHPTCTDLFEDPVMPHELADHKGLTGARTVHGMLGAKSGPVKTGEAHPRMRQGQDGFDGICLQGHGPSGKTRLR